MRVDTQCKAKQHGQVGKSKLGASIKDAKPKQKPRAPLCDEVGLIQLALRYSKSTTKS